MFAEGIIEKPGYDHDYYIKDSQLLLAHYGDGQVWQNCREIFQGNSSDDKRFFVRPTLSVDEMAKFVNHIEKIMNVAPKSKVHKALYKIKQDKVCCISSVPAIATSKPKRAAKKAPELVTYDNAICIDPSSFWTEHPVKLSFLTATLKIVDYEENIDYSRIKTANDLANYLIDIDDDSQYFRQTEVATRKFLAGFTFVKRSRKKSAGWVDVFGGEDKDKAKRVLLSPTIMVRSWWRKVICYF